METKQNQTEQNLSPREKLVQLDNPIIRNGETINAIALRKPKTGEMRGLSMVDILNMDVNGMSILLPRISSPMLSKEEVQALEPEDFVQLASEVAGFLVSKKLR